jgi:hypothetical protein
MRTILLLLISFILIVLLQECNLDNRNEITNSLFTKDSTFIEILPPCLPCCNAGRPHDCSNFPDGISLGVGNPQHDICITCQCCLDVWNYYGGSLPPEIPENIVNIVGCDETKTEH